MKLTVKQQRMVGCKMQHRGRCLTCRTDSDWRERVTGMKDFDCPRGYSRHKLPGGFCWYVPPGDAVHMVAKATGIKRLTEYIEKVTGATCGCKTRRDDMNRAGWRGLPRYIWRQLKKT